MATLAAALRPRGAPATPVCVTELSFASFPDVTLLPGLAPTAECIRSGVRGPGGAEAGQIGSARQAGGAFMSGADLALMIS